MFHPLSVLRQVLVDNMAFPLNGESKRLDERGKKSDEYSDWDSYMRFIERRVRI
jgi:hypothetical protein